MVTLMAKECLLIEETYFGLLKLVALLFYKMINSGKLSYTSVVKHGKGIKVIGTSELIRVFWFS